MAISVSAASEDPFAHIQQNLLEERGTSAVVINPGSFMLCIESATAFEPLSIPHCIAYYAAGARVDNGSQGHQQEDIFMEARREAACAQVSQQLEAALPPRNPTPSLPTSGAQLTYGTAWAWPHQGPGVPQTLIGDEALRFWADEPYRLVWPIREGRLHVNSSQSLQQVREALQAIWRHVLKKVGAEPAPGDDKSAAVLVVPLTFTTRDIKEVVDVVLLGLGFASVVVHVETVAATFGCGISSGCIVHLGHQLTSVCCVEDGSILPDTWRLLNYGSNDVADVLYWLLRRNGVWPPAAQFDPALRVRDRQTLGRIFDHCFVPMEGELSKLDSLIRQRPPAPLQLHSSKIASSAIHLPLGLAACFAPFAYLYPALLDPSPPSRLPNWLDDHGDLTEAAWTGEAMPRAADAVQRMAELRYAPPPATSSALLSGREVPPSLASAIVDSICSLPSPELQKRLFMNILVVGAGSRTPGLTDVIEEHALNGLPVTGCMETVNVIQPSSNPLHIVWRGGALLAALDDRESWVTTAEWTAATVDCARKDDLHAKLFLYTTPQR